MSRDPSNSDWWDEKFEATRRSVRQMEIEACRIRTNLAQLEAVNATGVITEETAVPEREEYADRPQVTSAVTSDGQTDLDWWPVSESRPEGLEILVAVPAPDEASPLPIPDPAVVEPQPPELPLLSRVIGRSRRAYRRITSPMTTSLVVHGAVLFVAASITVATVDSERIAPVVVNLGGDKSSESEPVDLQKLADLGEVGAENVVPDSAELGGIGAVSTDPIPVDFKSIDGPVSLGQAGLPSVLTTDLGALITGVGGLSTDGQGVPTALGTGISAVGAGGTRTAAGKASNRLDSTIFFGTEARGDRFVFVVDNSSSMKGGRLEMAIGELVRTVEALSARQNFYVIFVSDQTYPMFYPQQEPAMVPATPANKKRLVAWLPKAILASGKNRELIKAVDLAASLNPQAVYLLWDGDLRYSEKVRLDVITHLTQPRPNDRKFIVHTIGMGISSLDSEQNLRMIAEAHGGIYRRVDVPTGRAR